MEISAEILEAALLKITDIEDSVAEFLQFI